MPAGERIAGWDDGASQDMEMVDDRASLQIEEMSTQKSGRSRCQRPIRSEDLFDRQYFVQCGLPCRFSVGRL
jgi:hypothetical protein